MSTLLTQDQITEEIAALAGWELANDEISRQFQFADFEEAMHFVQAVADVAEDANHHPDIDIRWNKVLLKLSTHSKGGLTAADFAVAKKINALA